MPTMALSSEDSPTPPSSPPPAEAETTSPADGNQSLTPPAPHLPAKPTAQEEALSNTDILTLIFSTFLPTTPSPLDAVNRKFILDLALQCRSFSEPALDCLWKHLESLVPLIRLLPTAVFIDENYYLSGSADGLGDAFSTYAKRVRSLHTVDELGSAPRPSYQVDPSVYVSLSRLLGAAPLLPGLRTLHFEATSKTFASLHTLPLLLPCQSLTEIVLGGTMINSELSRRVALPQFISRAPSVISLTVSDELDAGQSQPGSFLRDGLSQFQHLKELNYTVNIAHSSVSWWRPAQLPPSFIDGLGRNLRLLQHLTLDLVLPVSPSGPTPFSKKKRPKKSVSRTASSISTPSAAAEPSSPTQEESRAIQDRFPNLRSLKLCHRSDTNVVKCYSISSLIHNVVQLTLTLRSSWIPTFPTIVDALAQSPFLRSLTLKENSIVSLSVDHVSLVLAHLNLDQLHLNVSLLRQLPQDISDSPSQGSAENCLGRIFTAATGLQEDPEPLRCLTLPLEWEHADANLTLLASVAKKAPDMQFISMSVDSTPTEPKLPELVSNISKPEISRESALKYLEIRDLRTEDSPFTPGEYKTIAHYIDTCFPNLMSIKLTADSNPYVKDHWVLIEQLRVMKQENRRLFEFAQARFRVPCSSSQS